MYRAAYVEKKKEELKEKRKNKRKTDGEAEGEDNKQEEKSAKKQKTEVPSKKLPPKLLCTHTFLHIIVEAGRGRRGEGGNLQLQARYCVAVQEHRRGCDARGFEGGSFLLMIFTHSLNSLTHSTTFLRHLFWFLY